MKENTNQPKLPEILSRRGIRHFAIVSREVCLQRMREADCLDDRLYWALILLSWCGPGISDTVVRKDANGFVIRDREARKIPASVGDINRVMEIPQPQRHLTYKAIRRMERKGLLGVENGFFILPDNPENNPKLPENLSEEANKDRTNLRPRNDFYAGRLKIKILSENWCEVSQFDPISAPELIDKPIFSAHEKLITLPFRIGTPEFIARLSEMEERIQGKYLTTIKGATAEAQQQGMETLEKLLAEVGEEITKITAGAARKVAGAAQSVTGHAMPSVKEERTIYPEHTASSSSESSVRNTRHPVEEGDDDAETTARNVPQTPEPAARTSTVLAALREAAPTADPDAARRLIEDCRRYDPTATGPEIVACIRAKAPTAIRKRNPTGFLMTAVPKCFEGQWRREETPPAPELTEQQRAAFLEETDRILRESLTAEEFTELWKKASS